MGQGGFTGALIMFGDGNQPRTVGAEVFHYHVIGQQGWGAVCGRNPVADIPAYSADVAKLRSADGQYRFRKHGYIFLYDGVTRDMGEARQRANADSVVRGKFYPPQNVKFLNAHQCAARKPALTDFD